MKPFTFDAGAGDEQAEYLRATLRKAGLPETLEVAEMRLEYGVRDQYDETWPYHSRAEAWEAKYGDDVLVVREVITLAWREVRDEH